MTVNWTNKTPQIGTFPSLPLSLLINTKRYLNCWRSCLCSVTVFWRFRTSWFDNWYFTRNCASSNSIFWRACFSVSKSFSARSRSDVSSACRIINFFLWLYLNLCTNYIPYIQNYISCNLFLPINITNIVQESMYPQCFGINNSDVFPCSFCIALWTFSALALQPPLYATEIINILVLEKKCFCVCAHTFWKK